jgi:threonine dehydrogenase-like Zn-dependent dehydrogenase
MRTRHRRLPHRRARAARRPAFPLVGVLGHEGVAQIEVIGDTGDGYQVGDTVLLDWPRCVALTAPCCVALTAPCCVALTDPRCTAISSAKAHIEALIETQWLTVRGGIVPYPF